MALIQICKLLCFALSRERIILCQKYELMHYCESMLPYSACPPCTAIHQRKEVKLW